MKRELAKRLERLERVRTISHKLGYGVGDAMDDILGQYGV